MKIIQTWSELRFLTEEGLDSDWRTTWMGSTSSSPSGLGEVTSSATSVADSSNSGRNSVGCLYTLSASDSSKLEHKKSGQY